MNELVMLVAYVRVSRRAAVAQALRATEVAGWTESNVVGHGHAAAGHEVEHIRFEVVMPKAKSAECAKSIVTAARTGATGDGMILTMPVLAIDRISDLTAGAAAL